MCEYWLYGCGHHVATPCPRPKPAAVSFTSSNQSSPRRQSSTSGNNGSNSSRQNSSYTNETSVSLVPSSEGLSRLSKFCNGYTTTPKETHTDCYPCILRDARRKVAQEAAEVEAKKAELKREGMSRTIARGPDGEYVDAFGRKIVAEDSFYQEDQGGRIGSVPRQRGFTAGPSRNGTGFGQGRQDELQFAPSVGRQRGFTDGNENGFGGNGRHGGFSGGRDVGLGGPFRVQQDNYAHQNGVLHQNGYVGGVSDGLRRNSYVPSGQTQQAFNGQTQQAFNGQFDLARQAFNGQYNFGGQEWQGQNGFGQSLNGFDPNFVNGRHY